ncbi:S8 family serine peptidase [Euzebya sp.]|uniref:S8 family serine peptidase n=1 Tax=Euzebya sp. TaxID=1971409 RepID=UPI003515FB99
MVNLSLGGPAASCPTALQAVIDAAIEAGTAVVSSAGNAGDATPNIPASCNGVISVGAVGPDASVARYSTTNDYVDVVAPGGAAAEGLTAATEVLTTSWWLSGARTEPLMPVTGTSFATPYVAGLLGLVRAVAPELTPAQLESLLESTATDLGPAGRDDDSGWGLATGAAVIAAAAGEPVADPAPDPDFPVGDAGPLRPGGDVPVVRVSAGEVPTEPITQAVAVSATLFADAGATEEARVPAAWAVVARSDDYADALAGSTLTLGAAPLLFTPSDGRLAGPTATELQRVLAAGSPVYLLGGPAAVPAAVEDDIRALGLTPVRLAGPVREATAVAIADEVDRVLVELGIGPAPMALLVNRDDWPDAVAAGLLGAQFGYPILLTPPDEVAAVTAEALAARDLNQLLVVGGTVRVSDAAMNSAADLSGVTTAVRLAGEERNGTVVAVSAAVEELLSETALGRPQTALAVNVRRADAYAHVLSATVPAGAATGVFIPVEGDAGDVVSDQAVGYARGLGLPLAIMGGTDVIVPDTATALEALVETPAAG